MNCDTRKRSVSAGLLKNLLERFLDSVGEINGQERIKLPWRDDQLFPIEIYEEKEVRIIKHG